MNNIVVENNSIFSDNYIIGEDKVKHKTTNNKTYFDYETILFL